MLNPKQDAEKRAKEETASAAVQKAAGANKVEEFLNDESTSR